MQLVHRACRRLANRGLATFVLPTLVLPTVVWQRGLATLVLPTVVWQRGLATFVLPTLVWQRGLATFVLPTLVWQRGLATFVLPTLVWQRGLATFVLPTLVWQRGLATFVLPTLVWQRGLATIVLPTGVWPTPSSQVIKSPENPGRFSSQNWDSTPGEHKAIRAGLSLETPAIQERAAQLLRHSIGILDFKIYRLLLPRASDYGQQQRILTSTVHQEPRTSGRGGPKFPPSHAEDDGMAGPRNAGAVVEFELEPESSPR